MAEYENAMLDQRTANTIHNKISDFRTQNVSAYDPKGLESLDTYVFISHPWILRRVT